MVLHLADWGVEHPLLADLHCASHNILLPFSSFRIINHFSDECSLIVIDVYSNTLLPFNFISIYIL